MVVGFDFLRLQGRPWFHLDRISSSGLATRSQPHLQTALFTTGLNTASTTNKHFPVPNRNHRIIVRLISSALEVQIMVSMRVPVTATAEDPPGPNSTSHRMLGVATQHATAFAPWKDDRGVKNTAVDLISFSSDTESDKGSEICTESSWPPQSSWSSRSSPAVNVIPPASKSRE